jgi:methyl-accepting chemotaxis protein
LLQSTETPPVVGFSGGPDYAGDDFFIVSELLINSICLVPKVDVPVLLSRLKVSSRFLLVLAIGIAVQAGISAQSLVKLRDELTADRKAEAKALVDAAYSIVAFYYDRATKGLMSDEAAREAAKGELRAIRYEGMNYFFVWDQNGVGVVHGSVPRFEGVEFINGSPAAAKLPYVGDMVTKLVAVGHTSSGEGFTEYNMTQPDQTKPVAKIAYNRLFRPWEWNIGTGVYLEDIDGTFWRQARTDLIVMVCMIVAAGLISYVLARDFSLALRRLSTRVQQVAAGELEGEIPDVDRGDEIGGVARALLVFRQAITDVRTARQSETERARQAELRRQQIEAATQDFERTVNDVVQGLHGASQTMDGCAQIMVEAAGHNLTRADATANASEAATTNVSSVATAAEEIALSVAEISNRARGSADIARHASDQAKSIISTVEQLVTAVGQINNVSGLIRNVATKTNLLALNATIEAARAGAAGRGFAVVAQEVKTLAAQTEKATGDITEQISSIEETTSSVVEAMKAIAGTIAQLNDNANEISVAVHQQDAVSKEIARSANAAAERTREVSASIEQVSGAANKTSQVAKAVLNAGNDLAAKSGTLQAEVERFLGKVRVA